MASPMDLVSQYPSTGRLRSARCSASFISSARLLRFDDSIWARRAVTPREAGAKLSFSLNAAHFSSHLVGRLRWEPGGAGSLEQGLRAPQRSTHRLEKGLGGPARRPGLGLTADRNPVHVVCERVVGQQIQNLKLLTTLAGAQKHKVKVSQLFRDSVVKN